MTGTGHGSSAPRTIAVGILAMLAFCGAARAPEPHAASPGSGSGALDLLVGSDDGQLTWLRRDEVRW